MPRINILSLAVAISLSTSSSLSQAIGLGNPPPNAVLNRPLAIELPIIAGDYDLHEIRVKVGSIEQHAQLSLEYPSTLPQLKFAAVETNNGPVLKVTSVRPLTEPFVNFALVLDYKGMQLLKEITILLDPIETFAAQSDHLKTPVISNIQTPNKIQSKTIERPKQIQTQPIQPVASQTIRVSKGQSLWQIAKEWEIPNVSLQQKMQSIFANNPQAFINQQQSKLKLGSLLQLKVSDILIADEAAQTSSEQNSIAIAQPAPSKTSHAAPPINVEQPEQQTSGSVSLVNAETNASPIIDHLELMQQQLEQQIALLNDKLQYEQTQNAKLKQDFARVEQVLLTLSQQTQLNEVPKATAFSATISPNTNPQTTSLTDRFTSANSIPMLQEKSNFGWINAAWLALALLSGYLGTQLITKRKVRKFKKHLNNQLKSFSNDAQKESPNAPTIKELSIPKNLSTSAQIKYLRSSADFYLNCHRYDLAKELVNESLIQFSGNSRIVKELLDIRQNIFRKLDADLQNNIVGKLDNHQPLVPGNETDFNYVLDEEDDSNFQALNDEFIREWNKKVSGMK